MDIPSYYYDGNNKIFSLFKKYSLFSKHIKNIDKLFNHSYFIYYIVANDLVYDDDIVKCLDTMFKKFSSENPNFCNNVCFHYLNKMLLSHAKSSADLFEFRKLFSKHYSFVSNFDLYKYKYIIIEILKLADKYSVKYNQILFEYIKYHGIDKEDYPEIIIINRHSI